MKPFYYFLFCIGICLCSLKANCQFNYKPAKLITLTNDTLNGYINDGGLFRNRKYCTYKKDKHSKPKRYYPKDIKGYQLNNGAYFSSQFNRDIDSVNMFFADVLIEGKYTLYHSNKANDLLFFIKTDSGKMVNLWNLSVEWTNPNPGVSRNYHYIDNIYLQFYKDTLKALFSDQPVMQKEIIDLDYKQKSMQKIVKEYINLSCKGNNCITYERKIKIMEDRFGVVAGVQLTQIDFSPSDQYSYDLESGTAISSPIGIFYSNPLYIISDKFVLQGELLYNQLHFSPKFSHISNDIAYSDIGIKQILLPISVKYRLLNRNISPTIGFGKIFSYGFDSKFKYINRYPDPEHEIPIIYAGEDNYIHWQQKGGWFAELGVNYKITPKYSCFANLRVSRQYNLVILDKFSNTKNFTTAEDDNRDSKFITQTMSLQVGFGF